MRILHISETDYEGGAGKAAHAIHRALRQKGCESFFLTECAQSDDEWTYTFSGFRGLAAKGLRGIRARLDQMPLRRYPRRNTGAWSVGWLPRIMPGIIRHLRPDIIHLHWISQALPVQMIGRLPGPVVWTHHDWGAFTGGCRCPVDCRQFTTGCGHCPQLHSNSPDDLSRRTHQRKQNAWQEMDLQSVAVGSGIAKDVGESLILGRHPCTVIPNGIDTKIFRPHDRAQARATLGLDPQEWIFLFGAFSLDIPLKGGHLLIDALARWRRRHPSTRARLVTVGLGTLEVASADLPVTALGLITSPERLALIYAAADVVVVPSRVESFGLMAAEAQACGVPVIAYAGTGIRDIVVPFQTGFLASEWNAEAFVQGLEWATSLSDSERGYVCGAACRNALTHFSLTTVVDAHLTLYRAFIKDDAND